MSKGVFFTVSVPSMVIRYSSVSTYYPVKVETDWAIYYLNKDYLTNQVPSNVVFANYEELAFFINTIEPEMALVREYSKNTLSIDLYGKIPIYYNNVFYTGGYAGFFRGKDENSSICLGVTVGTLHEYVHYATIGTLYQNVPSAFAGYFTEGIAMYEAFLFDHLFENIYYYEFLILGSTRPVEFLPFITNYETFLEENQTNFNIFDYIDCLVYTSRDLDIYDTERHYIPSSIVCYMIETYGSDLFWNYAGGQGTFEELYGKSLPDMLEEWNDWLIAKFE